MNIQFPNNKPSNIHNRSFKAKVRAKQSWDIRFADWMTQQSGSTWFLIVNILFFAVWIAINTLPNWNHFDPFPFTMLTTIVSLEAIILSLIILISQNVESKIADLREEIELEINTISEKEITKAIELLVAIAKKLDCEIIEDKETMKMLRPLDRSRIEHNLEKEI